MYESDMSSMGIFKKIHIYIRLKSTHVYGKHGGEMKLHRTVLGVYAYGTSGTSQCHYPVETNHLKNKNLEDPNYSTVTGTDIIVD